MKDLTQVMMLQLEPDLTSSIRSEIHGRTRDKDVCRSLYTEHLFYGFDSPRFRSLSGTIPPVASKYSM
jgi:hypothetical protein